jgi:uncharacterized protein (TIGR02217 family)
MSAAVLPALAGLGFPIDRTTIWKTRRQSSVSGKQVRIADWSIPLYQWALQYNLLRQGTITLTAFTEYSQLEGFFEQRLGAFDSFLYTDQDDNTVTAQAFGTGDGSTVSFQLQRSFGGASIPILAPNVVSTVYNNGTPVSGAAWSVTSWGSASPGVVTFTSAPAAGHTLTADFTFYFPCSFDDDNITFSKMFKSAYEAKKITFTSIK